MKRKFENESAPSLGVLGVWLRSVKGCVTVGRALGAVAVVAGALAGAGTASAQALPKLGMIPDSDAIIDAKMKLSAPMAVLPASVDMTSRFPSPGNQGQQGSCVGWAVAYDAKSYDEVVEEGWSPTTTNHQFSPSWIYNQINGGKDNGSSISRALDLIVDLGADTIDNFPYNQSNFTTQPNSASYTRAGSYLASDWHTVTVSESAIKSELARGNPVIIGMQVFPDFDTLNTTTNTLYDSSAGSSRGGHAVTLIGYDDARHAFKLINSWGTTSWGGQGGYGWIAYSFIADAKLGLRAYVLEDAPNPFSETKAWTWYVPSRVID